MAIYSLKIEIYLFMKWTTKENVSLVLELGEYLTIFSKTNERSSVFHDSIQVLSCCYAWFLGVLFLVVQWFEVVEH